MGLFSSKKKTVVGTVVSRVIEDRLLPNSVKTGVIKSIINSGDLSEHVLEELVSSIGLRADRMYEYARTTYTHGLPSGQIKGAMEGVPEVTAILSALEGQAVLLDYSHFAPPNPLHIGWTKAVADHGYDPVTNQLAGLTAIKGTPVYLEDMMVVVPAATLVDYAAGALEQWGPPATAGYTPKRTQQNLTGHLRDHTPVLADPLALTPHVRVNYIWVEAGNADPTGSFDIDLSGYDEALDYFHARYTLGGVVKYWSYQAGLGTYPTLDAVFDQPPAVNGTFFPFAYFRYNKVSEIEDTSTPAYLTSKKLVKYLGMDYDTVAAAIDENPDIADVEQAMLVMAVPANTEVECERKYLFSFFDNLYYSGENQFATRTRGEIAAWQADNLDLNKSSLIIQDSRFKMALSNGGIYKKRVGGSIGAVGSHSSGMGEFMHSTDYVDADGVPYVYTTPIKYHYYRRQITHALYDEIQVVNLKMLYYVIGNYTTTGDELDDILLIPLDRSITEDYSIPERELLYARSLHYVFNSVQIIKIKWYQQEWFQIVMIIAAIVLTVMSLGTLSGPAAALLSALGVTVTSTAMIFLVNLIVSMAIGAMLKLFVKAVGGEVALILAVIVTVYAGYQGFEAGSLAGAPWAKELLQLSSNLANGVSAFYADEMKNLVGDYLASLDLQKQLTDELNTAQKLLENDNYLSPFVILGEKPNEFYNRTVHFGNIGILSISAISNYVDTALRLPSLDDTLGDRAYV